VWWGEGSTVWRSFRETQRRSSQDAGGVVSERSEKESRSPTRDLLLIPSISK